MIGGFIVQHSTWSWIFWSTTIFQGIVQLSSLFLFSESYAPVLLQRRAKKWHEDTGDSRYHSGMEVRNSDRSAAKILSHSLSRPLRLLAFYPIIQMQAHLEGINYGLLYFALASFSSLFVSAYGESNRTCALRLGHTISPTLDGCRYRGLHIIARYADLRYHADCLCYGCLSLTYQLRHVYLAAFSLSLSHCFQTVYTRPLATDGVIVYQPFFQLVSRYQEHGFSGVLARD